MNEQLAKKIFSDQAYVETLLNMETAEEVQASLKEKGLELSVEDINETKNILVQRYNGELSEDDLEDISGGCITLATGFLIAGIISAVSAGTVTLGNKVHGWTGGRW